MKFVIRFVATALGVTFVIWVLQAIRPIGSFRDPGFMLGLAVATALMIVENHVEKYHRGEKPDVR